MERQQIENLLIALREEEIVVEEALDRLARLPFSDLGDARIDHHRALRQGMPEAVFAPGKTSDQCLRIVSNLLESSSGPVLLTRVNDEQRRVVLKKHPGATIAGSTLLWRAREPRDGSVAIVTAGTSDLPIATECELTLAGYGYKTTTFIDCGVSGVHRLFDALPSIQQSDVVIVVAGMEGALPSVVGGLIAKPIIAVPTSVGYGSSFEGITALLGMMSSCAPGLSVVGIDNGYGAACAAARILQ